MWGHDRSQLANMAAQAKAVLQADELEAVRERNRRAGSASRTLSIFPTATSIVVLPASG